VALQTNPFHKIFDLSELQRLRDGWKAAGEKVVFTNGVFDLIHPGHLIYLQEAADLGTKLILAINSDASVKMLGKGDSRPINKEQDRAIIMSAMSIIDAVVIFEEETPQNIINVLMPDVLVKGGDYTIDKIVGAKEVLANGGEVRQLQFVEGYSTTAIEQKIIATSLKK
jgi:D-glycero-beta-D-manno-heptose 1-phosphate adenylyltransferase